jgi:hypothetical protein
MSSTSTERRAEQPLTFEERELCLDAVMMVNRIFEADSRWLTRMCEEELRQRENPNEPQNIRT